MAKLPSVKPPPPRRAVFINCPSDEEFKPIFRAMVFTIIVSGCHPRCALDATDGGEVRVSKIALMIGDCDWGIHDLSRIEVDSGGLPRFNMPMELGIHLGARLLGERKHRRKRALILEAEPHRYDALLSDISGQDIAVHASDPDRAITCVRNWLSEHRRPNQPPLPGADAMARDYRQFRTEVDTIILENRLDPLGKLPHSDFLFVVRDWFDKRAAALR